MYMIFGTLRGLNGAKDISIKFGNSEITRAETYKYLGMKLNSRLTFGEHVFYIKEKTFSKIKLLGRLSVIQGTDTLLLLYNMLIL